MPKIGVIVLLFLSVLLSAFTAKSQTASTLVVVDAAKLVTEEVTLEAVGEARALRSVQLQPESSGQVIAVNIPTDGLIEEGDVLVELEEQRQIIAVGLAQIRRADAARLLDRYMRIEDPTAISPTVIDAARRDAELATLELEQAQIDLNDRRVIAPFRGNIGLYDIEVGDRVDSDTVIAQLDDRSKLRIRFSLPEQYFGRVSVGKTVEIYRWSHPQAPLTASIRQIDSQIDPATGTFKVKVEVDNQDDLLRPGMSLRVLTRLIGAEQIQVAETAVQWGDSGAYVWVVRNDQAERVGINLIGRRGNQALIRGDLQAGELVVIEGVQSLRPGSKLEFTTTEQLDATLPLPAIRQQPENAE